MVHLFLCSSHINRDSSHAAETFSLVSLLPLHLGFSHVLRLLNTEAIVEECESFLNRQSLCRKELVTSHSLIVDDCLLVSG